MIEQDLTHSINGNYVNWNYEHLYIIGIEGDLDITLEEVIKRNKDLVEFAPVKKEPNKDFLAGICFEPVTDITIAKGFHSCASILTKSLDNEKSKKLIMNIVKNSQFNCIKPSYDFINCLDYDMPLNVLLYESCKKLSQLINADLTKLFGACIYANLLTRYCGYKKENVIKQSAKRFGIYNKLFPQN